MCLGSHELINAAGVESTFGSKTGEARFRLFKKKKKYHLPYPGVGALKKLLKNFELVRFRF